MQIHNATHLFMEQVSDDQDGEIIDSLIIKDMLESTETGLSLSSQRISNIPINEIVIFLIAILCTIM